MKGFAGLLMIKSLQTKYLFFLFGLVLLEFYRGEPKLSEKIATCTFLFFSSNFKVFEIGFYWCWVLLSVFFPDAWVDSQVNAFIMLIYI